MLDLLKRKAANIQNIKTLVLDEADEMLNMGFREDIDAILANTPQTKRTLLFSATMPTEVARIAKNYMSDPIKITIGKQNSGAENIRHIFYQVHARDRYLALKRVADINPDIYGIVFCRTRSETKDVADKLIKDGYNADALHGDLSQAQRDHVMKRFRERNLQMLVATDVAARGIDIQDISHIINFNLPDDLDIYTHRSGRTGRAEKSGVSISLVNYKEQGKIAQIAHKLGQKFEKLQVPGGAEICRKQLYNMIDKMEHVEVDETQIAPFMDKVNKKLEWLSKEDIIKRFVSLEFNRFLEYYKNAPDLNKQAESIPREKREKKEYGNVKIKDKGERRRQTKQSGSFARFFMNAGRKDGLAPGHIIAMINEQTQDRDINIGDIDIKDSFSFFEVDKKYAPKVITAFDDLSYKGRKLHIEIAEAKEKVERDRVDFKKLKHKKRR
jgi:ATP-dependent RNA helicase DeaD